jgi:heme oxygenase
MNSLIDIRQQVLAQLKKTEVIESLLGDQPKKEAYIRYLTFVYQYAQHSPKVIALAASRCVNTHPELAKYLLHHAEEEQGHDIWALEDLRELGVDPEIVKATYPLTACASMIGFIYYTAAYANPVSLFGWLYVLEAMGDDLGSLAANKLNEGLGLSNKALRFVAGHGVNDQEHTADLTEQISKYLTNPQDMADTIHVAQVVAELYVGMFQEISGELVPCV